MPWSRSCRELTAPCSGFGRSRAAHPRVDRERRRPASRPAAAHQSRPGLLRHSQPSTRGSCRLDRGDPSFFADVKPAADTPLQITRSGVPPLHPVHVTPAVNDRRRNPPPSLPPRGLRFSSLPSHHDGLFLLFFLPLILMSGENLPADPSLFACVMAGLKLC